MKEGVFFLVLGLEEAVTLFDPPSGLRPRSFIVTSKIA